MGLLSTILTAVFGKKAAAPAGAPTASAPASPPSDATVSVPPGASSPEAAPAPQVDVDATLSALAAKSGEDLDWKRSIVDLLKVLGIDSSLANRKALAAELNYTGDTSDTATMNVWLHKQVVKKFAENGGKVPADLLD
ncbi:MAG TPA: DUF3597 domain-containing protein [Chthoniobacterales bacterium]